MKKQKSLKLYCFSPPVMIATFAIEIVAAVYVYLRFKSSRLQRLSIATLLLLATFQFAEYNVCGRFGVASSVWAQIGYVAITMLPPLGLHIVYELGKRKPGRFVAGAYASGILFSSLFIVGGAFDSFACGGNYVIFQLKEPLGGLFFVYYYFWLISAVLIAMKLAQGRLSSVRKKALFNMVIGYALFMIPTSVTILLFPETATALPSIMCGFAVLFALVLTFAVIPHVEKRRAYRKA